MHNRNVGQRNTKAKMKIWRNTHAKLPFDHNLHCNFLQRDDVGGKVHLPEATRSYLTTDVIVKIQDFFQLTRLHGYGCTQTSHKMNKKNSRTELEQPG